MKAEVGKYKFGRHRNNWGIWQWDWVSETGSSARFIKNLRRGSHRGISPQWLGNSQIYKESILIMCNKKSYRYGDNSSSKRNDSTSC